MFFSRISQPPFITTIADTQSAAQMSPVTTQAAGQGDGSWLWKSVASAAGSLTVNINKAWTAKVATVSGEGEYSFFCPGFWCRCVFLCFAKPKMRMR
jgi:hypothetical protein